MLNALKKWGKYISAFLTGKLDELADPEIQLQQAVAELQDRHSKLRDNVRDVVAREKKSKMDLAQALKEAKELERRAQAALLKSNEATQQGNVEKAGQFHELAASIADELTAKEAEIATLTELVARSEEASASAKEKLDDNEARMRSTMVEAKQLKAKISQTKLQESLNEANQQLDDEWATGDVPTLAQLEDKIEDRHARALATEEVAAGALGTAERELDRELRRSSSNARLEQMKSQLGLGGGQTVELPSSSEGDVRSDQLNTQPEQQAQQG